MIKERASPVIIKFQVYTAKAFMNVHDAIRILFDLIQKSLVHHQLLLKLKLK